MVTESTLKVKHLFLEMHELDNLSRHDKQELCEQLRFLMHGGDLRGNGNAEDVLTLDDTTPETLALKNAVHRIIYRTNDAPYTLTALQATAPPISQNATSSQSSQASSRDVPLCDLIDVLKTKTDTLKQLVDTLEAILKQL